MSRKLVLSLLAVVVALGLIGLGTYAMWSDSVEANDNTFSTGTLGLTVNGGHDSVAAITFTNQKPGDIADYSFDCRNTGSIDAGSLKLDGAFTGDLTDALVVHSVKVDGVEQLGVSGNPPVDTPLSSIAGYGLTLDMGSLASGVVKNVTISIELPSSAGNDTQGKTETGTMAFTLEQ